MHDKCEHWSFLLRIDFPFSHTICCVFCPIFGLQEIVVDRTQYYITYSVSPGPWNIFIANRYNILYTNHNTETIILNVFVKSYLTERSITFVTIKNEIQAWQEKDLDCRR